MSFSSGSPARRRTLERRRPRALRNGLLSQSRKHEVLAIAEGLRLALHEEDIIKDRRYHLRNYPRCFVGREVVDWLLAKGEADTRQQAISIMHNLEEYNTIHHVVDDHSFKDEFLFFRFRRDDGTYEEEPSADDQVAGQRLYSRLSASAQGLIADRRYHGRTYHTCVVGNELVDFVIAEGLFGSRHEAVAHLRDLVEAGVLHHVCHDHHFKDEYLFYRFINDEKTSRRDSKKSPRLTTASSSDPQLVHQSNSVVEPPSASQHGNRPLPASVHPPSNGTSHHAALAESRSLPAVSNASSGGAIVGRPRMMPPQEAPALPTGRHSHPSPPGSPIHRHGIQAAVTAAGTPPDFIYRVTTEELLDPDAAGYTRRHVRVVSDPVGFGFVIRGAAPVHVHTVDPTGPAAASGLQVGDFLLHVNGQDVLNFSHGEVAKLIVRGSAVAQLVVLTHPSMLHR